MVPPATIPNAVVKRPSADDNALVAGCESRPLPGYLCLKKFMNQKISAWENNLLKKNIPQIKVGDTIKVHQLIFEKGKGGQEKERVQIFEGVVIAIKHGRGMSASFTVRKIAADNIGVERVFPLHLPTIVKIERLKSSRPRRSKLYFLRQSTRQRAKLRGEKKDYKMWEEKQAEEELEKIKAEQEAEAKIKELEKAKEQEEFDKKFAAAQAAKAADR